MNILRIINLPWGIFFNLKQISAWLNRRGLALPLTRGGHEGGGINGYPDLDSEKAEHGCAVHCDATASGPVRGGESEGGSEGAAKVVGPGGHRLGNG